MTSRFFSVENRAHKSPLFSEHTVDAVCLSARAHHSANIELMLYVCLQGSIV